MATKKVVKKKEECKAYTLGKGRYASFNPGERCKRTAKRKGFCQQHYKERYA